MAAAEIRFLQHSQSAGKQVNVAKALEHGADEQDIAEAIQVGKMVR
jgi:hypothetical protein